MLLKGTFALAERTFQLLSLPRKSVKLENATSYHCQKFQLGNSSCSSKSLQGIWFTTEWVDKPSVLITLRGVSCLKKDFLWNQLTKQLRKLFMVVDWAKSGMMLLFQLRLFCNLPCFKGNKKTVNAFNKYKHKQLERCAVLHAI